MWWTDQSKVRAAIDRSHSGKSAGSALSRNYLDMDKGTNHARERTRKGKWRWRCTVALVGKLCTTGIRGSYCFCFCCWPLGGDDIHVKAVLTQSLGCKTNHTTPYSLEAMSPDIKLKGSSCRMLVQNNECFLFQSNGKAKTGLTADKRIIAGWGLRDETTFSLRGQTYSLNSW